MNSSDQIVARELKKKLAALVDIVDLRVFGSRAKETADQYSDMDVFIEVESLSREQKEKIYETAWNVGLEKGLVISMIICTRKEIEKSPLKASPLIKNILSDGISL